MAKVIQDPLPVQPPVKRFPSWDILFDIRQPDAEHPNGHYVIHKPTGHQWEKGELDKAVFAIVRCECEEKDLPGFQSWQKVLREQYLYDVPTEKVGEIDTVPVEMIRVKVADGKETRGWLKDIPQYRTVKVPQTVYVFHFADGSTEEETNEYAYMEFDEEVIRTETRREFVDVQQFAGFQQEWLELEDGKYSLRLTYAEVDEQKENFRIDQSIFTPTLLIEKNIYDIDRGTMGACLVATSTAEKLETQKLLDTRQNAILTVGTGKTYSTISAAITASSSGDIIEAYATTANTYTENVSFAAKGLQLLGMVASRGLTITKSSGVVVTLEGGSYGSLMQNFTITATGTATIALAAWYNCYLSTLQDLYISGGTTGAARGYIGTRFINCVFANSAGYGFWSDQTVQAFYCTAVKNGTYGFSGNTAAVICFHCIAAGNTTADFTTIPVYSTWNVSADASANGVSAVTGFLTTDFVDYAGNDFRLKASVAATTKARFLGYPITHDDAFGNERKTTGVVFAGWSDPDPKVDVYPAVGHVRAPDVYGPGGTGYVGTETQAAANKVLVGSPTYGADGTEFTPSYTVTIPAKPTVIIKSVASGTVTLTITGVVGTAYAYYRKGTSGVWSAKSESWKRTSDGDIAITGLDNGQPYSFMAQNEDGVPSRISESDYVYTTPTAGTKAASGALSLPMENLRTLLANSAHFQAWVGVADAESAKAHIYIAAIAGTSVEPARPYALITNDSPAVYESESVAGGASNAYQESGTLYLLFEEDVASADQASYQDSSFVFQNDIGDFISDMEAIAGSAAYLNVRSFTPYHGPARSAREDSKDYFQMVWKIDWGI